ncbi:mannitol dehydrogenase family protein [Cognatiyoonia sp. IB215182]|uniref:mannitol dehydrogenase family protein n=1 Tax=Cognatiyoonia sp. IB215182 TaxID=3097353 RepID=UPI002A15D602|nr:mannitol dehydrogenase family protein [Cognatiyoonia sp. IB215182]MDX8354931.1 mannitol dehydrogenase family protein [Cognatiyoonia sp. IB215182]
MRDHDAKLIPLSNQTLNDLPAAILRPKYDRKALTPGIVHIGLGNFHRAHQAWYLHRLMQEGQALDWAIIGASVRNEDSAQRQRLAEQDHLTTLIELDPSGTSAEVIGSMIGYVPIEDGHGPLIRQMADPRIRIVSLTVTEGGYFLDPATKRFDDRHPDIQHDARHLDRPRTAFGAIVAALRARRDADAGPFTCQSCDNLPGNGTILRDVVVGLGNLADPELGAWIEQNARFPNSMVDCIVPATGTKERALAQSLGIADQAPVTHENFRQWVMEDDFCAGRPPWENAGATLSDRVHDYEAMKLRLLNGGHQIIAAPAELLGLETIADAMAHDLIRGFLRKVALTEIVPHVPAVREMTPVQYVELIDQRFSNPAIHDTVRRVAFDGSSRHTGAVIPVIRDAISNGAELEGLALSQALWASMCRGQRENGSAIAPNDPAWKQLNAAAHQAIANPQAWLEQRQFYGSIGEDDRFRSAFARCFNALRGDGLESTIGRYLNP